MKNWVCDGLVFFLRRRGRSTLCYVEAVGPPAAAAPVALPLEIDRSCL